MEDALAFLEKEILAFENILAELDGKGGRKKNLIFRGHVPPPLPPSELVVHMLILTSVTIQHTLYILSLLSYTSLLLVLSVDTWPSLKAVVSMWDGVDRVES